MAAATVGDELRRAALRLTETGSETPRLDAELLLGHVLGVSRTTLLAEPEAALSSDQQRAFALLLERRATGEPVSYIRGLKEFYGLALSVDRRALIPRPETELVVDLALARLRRLLTGGPRPADAGPLVVWDVGTGSGAIAIAMAVECRRRGYQRDVVLRATDAAADALELAVQNAVAHGVADMIEFAAIELGALPAHGRCDLLLANLPYVPSGQVPRLPVAARFEPVAALDGGTDGLDVIRELLAVLPKLLAPSGVALLEFGADQRDALAGAVDAALPGWHLTVHRDLAGQPRVAEIEAEAGPSHG